MLRDTYFLSLLLHACSHEFYYMSVGKDRFKNPETYLKKVWTLTNKGICATNIANTIACVKKHLYGKLSKDLQNPFNNFNHKFKASSYWK